MSDAIYALIMAGGSGTRFWPASRRAQPKQLLALTSANAMLRDAVNRILPLCSADHLLVATGAHLVKPTAEVLPELSRSQFLVEPVGRNTAPCIGWAAHTVARRDPEAVVMALPSDPFIRDVPAYQRCLEEAVSSAQRGIITTIGIQPTHPETGYGYIEAKPGDGAVRRVERFVEKPDHERAVQFLEAGNFFWNAGMFFFRAKDMVQAIATHLPELSSGLSELDAAAAADSESDKVVEIFGSLPSISIDHGVMEKVAELAMVPGDFGWSDVGSWMSASDLAEKDPERNSGPRETVFVAAKNNHVVDLRSGAAKRVIALVGVDDLVVVETDDALLVVHREQAQHVRDVVKALTERGDSDLV